MQTYFQNLLKEHDLKVTKNRLMMLEALQEDDTFLSAEALHKKLLKHNKTLSLSTVYRAMEALVEVGIISPVNIETSKETLYELSHDEHAHHLICLKCHKIIHFHHCPVQGYGQTIEKQYGFKVKEHKLELYGYCDKCQNA